MSYSGGRGEGMLRQWQILIRLAAARSSLKLTDFADIQREHAVVERTIRRDLQMLTGVFPISTYVRDGARRWALDNASTVPYFMPLPQHATKRCNACQTPKPMAEFSKLSVSRDGHSGRCKSCDNQRHRQWWQKRHK